MNGLFSKVSAFIAVHVFPLLRMILFLSLGVSFILELSVWIKIAILTSILVVSFAELFWPKIGPFLNRYKERIGILGVGILGNQVMVWLFLWVLYPYVIWELGLIFGFAVMLVLSFLVCYGTILFYDWSKTDWLGIETMKELKEYRGSSKFAKVISWVMKQSDPIVLVFLSIKFDPFITTVYMRKGSNKYDGMGRRDWKIFMISLVIGDICWSIAVFTGLSVVEHLINFVSSF
jgi:hypothetical protein